jgi:hypothetical protein
MAWVAAGTSCGPTRQLATPSHRAHTRHVQPTPAPPRDSQAHRDDQSRTRLHANSWCVRGRQTAHLFSACFTACRRASPANVAEQPFGFGCVGLTDGVGDYSCGVAAWLHLMPTPISKPTPNRRACTRKTRSGDGRCMLVWWRSAQRHRCDARCGLAVGARHVV